MKRLLLACTLLAAAGANAQVVAAAGGGIVVAHDGTLGFHDAAGRGPVWHTDGVAAPRRIVASDARVAVIDSLASEVRLVDLSARRAETITVGETPVDAAFVGDDLFVLSRDARTLERIAASGRRSSVATAADPALLRAVNGRLLVYSRTGGAIQEFDPGSLRMTRQAPVPPFASDMEADGRHVYLVYPREARVRAFAVSTLQPAGETRAGAVPVDLAFVSGSTALTARTLAVADPAARRVWFIEGAQTTAQAFGRGFLRGLLGIGLFGGRQTRFATGVDRIVTSGRVRVAYDSATRTLYRFDRRESRVVARDVAPQAFLVTADGIIRWSNGTLVAEESGR